MVAFSRPSLQMKVSIVYVYAPVAGAKYEFYACRFLDSYYHNPPGADHETIVMLNGSHETSELNCMFGPLPNLRFIQHDNSGYDIGAFQHASRDCNSEMIVFFGSSTYFYRPGWLLRMRQAFTKYGNAQYGAMGNRGNLAVRVWPHIRTTAFWMSPQLMNAYPKIVRRKEERHPFEHGPECFTSWAKSKGVKSWVITWERDLTWQDWDSDPNGFHRGNQSNLLAGDHISERPYYPNNKCRNPVPPIEYCEPWQSDNCWNCLSKPHEANSRVLPLPVLSK